jgi:hypothetical protein
MRILAEVPQNSKIRERGAYSYERRAIVAPDLSELQQDILKNDLDRTLVSRVAPVNAPAIFLSCGVGELNEREVARFDCMHVGAGQHLLKSGIVFEDLADSHDEELEVVRQLEKS